MLQTFHHVEGLGEVFFTETPLSKGRNSALWNIDIHIQDKGIDYRKTGICQKELDNTMIDMLARIMDGDLSDFRVYEFWEN